MTGTAPLPDLAFGVTLSGALPLSRLDGLASLADGAGLDLLGIPDHPYAAQAAETMSLLAHLLDRTQRIHVFPDVANLPLRPPAMLAIAAATLNRQSGGRFELGLGAGGYWQGIEAMGGSRRTTRDALEAASDAMVLIRALWHHGRPAHLPGRHYELRGAQGVDAGPGGIELWFGAQGPRSLRVTGQLADGWAAPLASYVAYEEWGPANRTISEAAREAGRDPRSVRRVAQLVGSIAPDGASGAAPSRLAGDAPIRSTGRGWAEVLARLAEEMGFTSFVLWPEQPDEEQLRRFAEDVVPRTRERLAVPSPEQDALVTTRADVDEPRSITAGARPCP